MSKKIPTKRYQGFHTHPSQDSTTKMLDNGIILVTHRVDRREGFIITQLAKQGMTTADLTNTLNSVFAGGGYGINHVKHACDRLREDGILKLDGHTWTLTPNARSKWEKIKKSISTFKGKK